MRVTKGLFIRPHWLEPILDGAKTWEMRSRGTKFRGWFALIGARTGMIWGVANLVDVKRPQNLTEMLATIDRHRIPEDILRSGEVAKWTTPWVIDGVRRLPEPIPNRAVGQTWANLDSEATLAIERQLTRTAPREGQHAI